MILLFLIPATVAATYPTCRPSPYAGFGFKYDAKVDASSACAIIYSTMCSSLDVLNAFEGLRETRNYERESCAFFTVDERGEMLLGLIDALSTSAQGGRVFVLVAHGGWGVCFVRWRESWRVGSGKSEFSGHV